MTRTWQTLIVVASAAAALAIGLGAQAGGVNETPHAVVASR
jgi:hypothetical protein